MSVVRIRIAVLVVALAVLAFAGLRSGDHQPADVHPCSSSSGRLAAQPAPEPALPAIASAAAIGTTILQTLPFSEWPGHVRPVRRATAVAGVSLVWSAAPAARRDYPLLI
jgi:hypothetical protein